MLSTGGSPLFVVITNIRFCVLTKNVYTKRLELFYSSNFTRLDLIALGPCDQTAVFVSEKSKKCTLITAIDVQSALEMIGSLEYAYRRSGLYDPNNAFVVININCDDKLYESVKSQISIPKVNLSSWCLISTQFVGIKLIFFSRMKKSNIIHGCGIIKKVNLQIV